MSNSVNVRVILQVFFLMKNDSTDSRAALYTRGFKVCKLY